MIKYFTALVFKGLLLQKYEYVLKSMCNVFLGKFILELGIYVEKIHIT